MPTYTFQKDPEAFFAFSRDERNKMFPQFPDTSGPTLAAVLASRKADAFQRINGVCHAPKKSTRNKPIIDKALRPRGKAVSPEPKSVEEEDEVSESGGGSEEETPEEDISEEEVSEEDEQSTVEESEKELLVRKPFKEASPVPPGVPIAHWYRCFNSADSWFYNTTSKNKEESAKARRSGKTRLRAFEIVNQRQEKGVFKTGPDYLGFDLVKEVENEDDEE